MSVLEQLEANESLSIEKVAEVTGRTESTIVRWIRSGVAGIQLPAVKVGARYTVFRNDLDVFLDALNN